MLKNIDKKRLKKKAEIYAYCVRTITSAGIIALIIGLVGINNSTISSPKTLPLIFLKNEILLLDKIAIVVGILSIAFGLLLAWHVIRIRKEFKSNEENNSFNVKR